MNSVSRQLVALDMLSQDLEETSAEQAPKQYERVLRQYLSQLEKLEILAAPLTENGYTQAVDASNLCAELRTKKMVTIYIRLLEFILKYFELDAKAQVILDKQFDERSDRRLDLLQSRAIKARNQFKIVAKALGEEDYRRFCATLSLSREDWGWQSLFL